MIMMQNLQFLTAEYCIKPSKTSAYKFTFCKKKRQQKYCLILHKNIKKMQPILDKH